MQRRQDLRRKHLEDVISDTVEPGTGAATCTLKLVLDVVRGRRFRVQLHVTTRCGQAARAERKGAPTGAMALKARFGVDTVVK